MKTILNHGIRITSRPIAILASLLVLSLFVSACGTLSSAAPQVATQVSAIEAAANAYCDVAGPSDPEIAKICDYIHTGTLTAEAGVNAILNILRTRAARSLQSKAAVHASAVPKGMTPEEIARGGQ